MAYLYPERKSQPGSAERNAQPLAEAVAPLLQDLAARRTRLSSHNNASSGTPGPASPPVRVLEVGSGEGVQIAAIARAVARPASDQSNHDAVAASLMLFQPTEVDEASARHVDETCRGVENVAPCRCLQIDNGHEWRAFASDAHAKDASAARAVAPYDALFVFNVVHIVPWATVETLFAQANPSMGILAPEHGLVMLYGAFNENGQFTSTGNERFQAYLKEKDESFGLRDVQHALVPLAHMNGFELRHRIPMPAGNLLLVFGMMRIS